MFVNKKIMVNVNIIEKLEKRNIFCFNLYMIILMKVYFMINF